ncbi:Ig-like domain-containing protein [Methanobrevibacter sp.]|uniref:Ig-like domain-containing protein n=1 Tax=Methanobrevibacter sp. TaxID=66852 RepID=UPI0026DFD2E5|nr:Ig-like domain-containing protein [Methanobrevibacter sp.]MDO5859154.1 Ig-like domain-containing protein [Methanobrevibacter sp.]
MDRKIVIVLAIVVVIAVLVGLVALNPNQGKDATSINILTSSALKNGDAVKFQLTDSKGNSISGEEILISLSDGETKNNYSITTDNDGRGSLVLKDMAPGNYSIMLSYNGNDKYNASNVVQKLVIEENDTVSSNQTAQVEETTHSQENSSSADASSSSQESNSSGDSISYDSKLNVYYDSEGTVVDPDGNHGMGVGEKYEDLVEHSKDVDENGLN